MSKTEKKPVEKVPCCNIGLEGKALEDFNIVKAKIVTATPGIKPNNADIGRHALHLAAVSCKQAGTG